MKTQTTVHPLQEDWVNTWPTEDRHVVPLLDLIRAKLNEKAQSERSNGKKRSHSPTHTVKQKRARTEINADVSTTRETDSSDDTLLPVYSHTFIFAYVGERNASKGIQACLELLDANRDMVPLELGDVLILSSNHPYNSKHLSLQSSRWGYPIVELPPLRSEIKLDDFDFRSNELSDVIRLADMSRGRFHLDCTLTLETNPHNTPTFKNSLFQLHAQVKMSLNFPTICQPFPSSSRSSTDEGEYQRRILNFLFPYNGPVPEAFDNTIDIRLLFSILRPAPSLPSLLIEQAAQPAALRPTLRPFQRRSVAWLLAREGKQISPQGEIVPLESTGDDCLPLFWESIVGEDDFKFYINRLTGQVSLTRPEDDAPLGGILAEEPGLGKTLESIALILLNPAVGRNPSNRTWDPVAKIDVREVPTTLIVTPISLAPQWADEIAKHAPTLKVLIYEGWAKVKVPISEADLEAARREQQTKQRKSKSKAARDAAIAKGKRIKRPTKRGPRSTIKIEDSDDSDIEMVDSPATESSVQDDDGLVDWCTYVSGYDVVITTYNILQQDLGVARPPPVRPRRSNVQYSNLERSRSPLIMCEWYRVIMDEVQMAGGGKTEYVDVLYLAREMVSLIPRLSSFAVSGTPARSQISDMIHVLKFLRVTSVTDEWRAWAHLMKPGYVHEFAQLFNRFTIRTMKNAVKDELTIPKQTRYLVPVELGRVERLVYDQHFEYALLSLGLDARGVAVREDWQPDTAALRTWLRKLRGICTHPQVGQLLNQNDKINKPGVLKTIGEVLEGMKEQNWRNYMEDRRNRVEAHTRLVQLKQHDQGDMNRYKNALEVLLNAEKEALALIADIQAVLDEHAAKGEILKAQAKETQASLGGAVTNPTNSAEHQPRTGTEGGENGQSSEQDLNRGKGKERVRELSPSNLSDGSEDIGIPKNAAGDEHLHKRMALQQRLREAQIVLHKVYFLKGDVYHILGATHSDAENEAYAGAEELRRLLLKSTEAAAKRAMAQLVHDASKEGLSEEELYIDVPFFGKGAIKSQQLMEEANEMIDELLNEQSALLWQWRTRLIGLLTQSLTSDGDDADGQEYTRSLETQGEAETYLQAYAALLADRREALTSERTLLAAHDDREKKIRKTKAAKKAAEAALEEEVLMQIGDLDPQPEHQVLQQELKDERTALLEDFNTGRALRSVMVDLNNVAARIADDKNPERVIAREAASRLRKLLTEQAKLMEKLTADLALLRKAFNERISYFRQLQELSDTVAEAEWEGSLPEAIAKVQAERAGLEIKIATGRAKQRYLDNMASTQEEGASSGEDEDCCILCKCEFSRGYITGCAHVFCEDCMKAWLGKGKACPICRVPIESDQLQRFAMVDPKTQLPAAAPARIVNNEPVPKSRREIQYNLIEPDLFESIQMMESHGSYGSKIQTLVRHLLYVQTADPGSKTIVFSAWADSLHIIQHALNANFISCLRIDQNSGRQNAAKRFRTDPTIQVLLLHGERENAGLNVTCAARVILVESVVNHAFELQAIARIDRMGQTRPTEVYCYYAEDTVERNILDLAARQGLSLYTKDNSSGTLNVEPLKAAMQPTDKNEVDAPTKKVQKGDFVFKTDDMLAIFFPHLFEEVEYLLPADESEATNGSLTARSSRFENAVAGPSTQRL